eukprot:7203824-Pyramimonas_sp.AAC.2
MLRCTLVPYLYGQTRVSRASQQHVFLCPDASSQSCDSPSSLSPHRPSVEGRQGQVLEGREPWWYWCSLGSLTMHSLLQSGMRVGDVPLRVGCQCCCGEVARLRLHSHAICQRWHLRPH